jgi:uncharacterized repeat protein (TIGR02543 family)
MKKHIVVAFALSLILLPFVASAYTVTLTAPTAGDYPRSQDISVAWTAVGPVTSLVDLELRKVSDNSLVASVNSLSLASSPYNFNPLSHAVLAGTYYFKAKLLSYDRSLLFATSASTPNFTILNGPDLIISTPTILTVNPTTVSAGGVVSLPSWEMKNQGDAPANNFVSDIRLSPDSIITTADTYLGGGGSNSLAPGEIFSLVGSTVTIPTNTPAGNYFVGWLLDRNNTVAESNETNNYKSAPLTVTNAAPVTHTLTVAKIGSGSGVVSSFPELGIDCGSDCSESYDSSVSPGLSASASTGSVFVGWSGDCTGTNITCTVAMTADKNAVAEFALATPPCAGSPCVSMVYPNGGETLIKGQPNTIRWFSNGVPIANPSPLDHFQIELGNWVFSAPMGWDNFTSTLTNSSAGSSPVGDNLPPGRYRMTVAYYRNEQRIVSDTSDNWFTIATSSPITVTAPNGGEVWQSNRSHVIQWTPYGYNPDINPASTTVAYLEKKVNGNFVMVGKIIPDEMASLYTRGFLIGEFQELVPNPLYPGGYWYNPPPFLPPPGDYYVRVVNKITGAWDRSDNPFTLVSENAIWADLKINSANTEPILTSPIIIPKGSNNTDYLASWTSNSQEKCSLDYFFERYPASIDPNNWVWNEIYDLPSSGFRNIKVFPFANVQPGARGYVSLNCPTSMSGSGVEGSGFDVIDLYYDSIPTTATAGVVGASTVKVISPNGEKAINWSTPQVIAWSASADVENVSIALYKDSKFFKWIARDLPSQIKSYRWTPSKTISAGELGNNFQINVVGRKKVYTGMITDKSDIPFSIVNSTPTPADTTPPSTITDLKLTGTYPNGQVGLNWRAPYEDSNNPTSGAVTSYDIRYQIKSPITDSSWSRAVQVTDEPTPRAPGTVEIYFLSNLTSRQTYYVAIRSQDAMGNISALSNNVVIKMPISPTPLPPPIIPSPIDPIPIPLPLLPTTTAPIVPTPTPIIILPTLLSADPPNNAVDARDLSGRLGWKFVSLAFSAHLGSDWNLATDYTISTTNAESIGISNISGSAVQPIAVFSRKIVPGERVTVTHQPTGAKVCLGFLPGDVDQNGFATNLDIGRLNSWVGTTEGATQPLWKTDINRDEVFDQTDVTRANELLSAPDRVIRLPACPSTSLGASPNQNQLANVFSTLRQALEVWSQLLISR